MTNYNPLLCCDFYKVCHQAQYPVGLTKMVSYYTPRMTRLKDTDHVTLFGLQAFIKEYLIDGFQRNFFNRPEDEVIENEIPVEEKITETETETVEEPVEEVTEEPTV